MAVESRAGGGLFARSCVVSGHIVVGRSTPITPRRLPLAAAALRAYAREGKVGLKRPNRE